MKPMMSYFMENVDRIPDRKAVAVPGQGSCTFAELDRQSARVYRYLTEKGIGKEDFVMLCLPRSFWAVVCMVGVWKAGAAFTMVEDTYAPDRIRFIYEDSGCKLKIDMDTVQRILELEPLPGYREAQLHDAAFAVYTSGTTGNPKGVLHEYGNLMTGVEESMVSESEGTALLETDDLDVFGLLAPLNFVASIISVLDTLIYGTTLVIIPYAVAKDFRKLKDCMLSERITSIFMTAAYVRLYDNWSPYLKTVYFGSEPANGLSIKGPELFNVYSLSECGFDICAFRLDKAYDPAPIGKPMPGRTVYLLDENGNPVQQGETGEICVAVPYVRGYINLPERTAETFRGGILHSGDLARTDADGNYYIVGRRDDMIKINGNRVEPAETETVFRELSGLRTVVVKGFSDESRACLCLYYLRAEAEALPDFRLDDLKQRMSERLPYYMIPSYFVALEEMPLNPNGKLNKKALTLPEAVDYRAEYAAPENETERLLCDTFAKALKLDRVGANDDFYLIGGDSMSAIAAVTGCALDGLSITDLYEGRTPRKIAARWLDRRNDPEDPAETREEDLRGEWALLPEQQHVLDDQLTRPESTVWLLPGALRLKDGTDPERFAAAVNKAIRNHPSLAAVLCFSGEAAQVQRYAPELLPVVTVTDIPEDELQERINGMTCPFRLFDSCLCRFEVFRTENGSYFVWVIHHLIFDGTSMGLLFDSIVACYADPDCQLRPDYYFSMLKRQALAEKSSLFEETELYYRRNYEDRMHPEKWMLLFRSDPGQEAEGLDVDYCRLKFGREEIMASAAWKQIGFNGLYLASLMLAQSIYNDVPYGIIGWLHNGRTDAYSLASCGLLFRCFMILEPDMRDITLKQLLQDMHSQMDYSLSHNCYGYPYRSRAPLDMVCNLLYQEKIYDTGSMDDLTEESPFEPPESRDIIIPLGMEVRDNMDGNDPLAIVAYDSAMYAPESAGFVLLLFCACLREMISVTDPDRVTLREIADRALKAAESEAEE
ncbi:MAG: non-ribosomal peptide synthetase [Clostridia bacterium]|nr:non-ribosomal peptide synthetase [Clostridia bacterium]